MFKSDEKGTGWQIFRIIMALITFAVFIYQMYFAGQCLMNNEYDAETRKKVFVASIVGGLFMLFLSILFIKKPLKNIIYSVGVAAGKITPEVPKITDPLADEIREMEKMSSDGVNTIEYYRGYDKDGIDFSKEPKYPEGYTPPTLEKDIEVYAGYEEDCLDFAREKPDKKDISEF